MKYLTGAIAVAALLADVKPVSAQCSICQSALANAENGGIVTAGFRQGIGLMLIVMAVLGAIGWVVARRSRLRFLSRDPRRNQLSEVNANFRAEHSSGK